MPVLAPAAATAAAAAPLLALACPWLLALPDPIAPLAQTLLCSVRAHTWLRLLRCCSMCPLRLLRCCLLHLQPLPALLAHPQHVVLNQHRLLLCRLVFQKVRRNATLRLLRHRLVRRGQQRRLLVPKIGGAVALRLRHPGRWQGRCCVLEIWSGPALFLARLVQEQRGCGGGAWQGASMLRRRRRSSSSRYA